MEQRTTCSKLDGNSCTDQQGGAHASLHDLLDMVRGIRVYGSTLYNYNYRDNNNNYRTCIMYIQLLRPFSFDHYASSTWYIMTCTVHPGLVSCNFYACTIPISLICKKKILIIYLIVMIHVYT